MTSMQSNPGATRPVTARRVVTALAAFAFVLGLSTAAPAETVSSSLQPRVRIETTAGAFVIEVDTARSPLTAENFLRYVRSGYYDGLLMHRVIANFVVQGGGYTPDYQPRETAAAIPNESGNGLSNARGSVGMARGDSPHSATSQFYVNVKDNPGLNPLPSRWGYTVFGQVVEGMDVVDRITYAATGERAGFADTPMEPIVIQRAFVVGEQDGTPAPEPAVTDVPAEAAPPAEQNREAQPGGTVEGATPAGEAAAAEASAPPEGAAATSQP